MIAHALAAVEGLSFSRDYLAMRSYGMSETPLMSSTGFTTRGSRCAGDTEEAPEGEVADALGRERYEGEKGGYRNGYRTGKVKTAETE